MKRFFLPCFLLLGLTTSALASDVLSRKIAVSLQKTALQAALDEVARAGRFEWSYNPSILPEGKPTVSLSVEDWTVREVLYEILGQEYAFKTNGNYVIIKRQNKTKDQLSGYLRNPADGTRIVNATVYDKKTLRAVTTDSTGYYELKVKKSSEIVVARLGYRDTVLFVTPASPRFQKISLPPLDTVHHTKELSPQEAVQLALRNASSELERFFYATLDKWHEINVTDSLHRRAQISLVPGIGTNHVLSRKVTNDFSLNIIAGQSANVRILEVGGVANFTRKNVEGAQIGGVLNLVRGSCSGVQVAGAYNQVLDTLAGAQISGVMSLSRCTRGVAWQASGLLNYTMDDETGVVQVAGLLNRADKALILQAAGLFNTADTAKAVQIAGAFNTANEMDGLQISGVMNNARQARGVQISVINRARKMRGVQIGLINLTSNLQGTQIGLINRSGKRWTILFNAGRSRRVN
jgi:hypothetical protein